jgi:hypothetical protein
MRVHLAGDLPVAFAVPGLLFTLTAAFQFGYFLQVGLEFISFIGPGDWLLPAGLLTVATVLLSVPVLAFGFITSLYWPGWLGGFFPSRPHPLSRPSPTPKLVWGGLILAAMAGGVLLERQDIMFPVVTMALLFLVVYTSSNILIEYRRHGSISVGTCTRFMLVATLFPLALGFSYAMIAGGACSVVLRDGRFENGRYLRFIGDGHLIRMGGRTFFVNKSEVKEIVCGKFKPSR